MIDVLRAGGHDILAIAEEMPGADDRSVIDLARRAGRVLLTEDKDFGQLVFAAGRGAAGVLLLRYPAGARRRLAVDVAALLAEMAERLPGQFVVIQPGKVRMRTARVRTSKRR